MKVCTGAIIVPAIVAITDSGQVRSVDIAQNICILVESDNKSRLGDRLKNPTSSD